MTETVSSETQCLGDVSPQSTHDKPVTVNLNIFRKHPPWAALLRFLSTAGSTARNVALPSLQLSSISHILVFFSRTRQECRGRPVVAMWCCRLRQAMNCDIVAYEATDFMHHMKEHSWESDLH